MSTQIRVRTKRDHERELETETTLPRLAFYHLPDSFKDFLSSLKCISTTRVKCTTTIDSILNRRSIIVEGKKDKDGEGTPVGFEPLLGVFVSVKLGSRVKPITKISLDRHYVPDV